MLTMLRSKTKLSQENRHLGVDREMTLMHLIAENGQPLGSVNWFANTHLNLPNNFYKLCSDNKGFAASYLEDSFKRQPKLCCCLCTRSCGDVSTRVKYNKNFLHSGVNGRVIFLMI